MGEFIGEVKPLYGRWHWPLRAMKPGDYFIVDKALRSTEEVRNLMSVRASQMGMRISVSKHPEDHPGYTRVEMMDLNKPEEKPDGAMMNYETAGEKLEAWYGFDINSLPYGYIYGKGQERIHQAQINEPSIRRMIVDCGEYNRVVGFVFDVQGFTCHALPKRATFDSWKLDAPAPTLEELMS